MGSLIVIGGGIVGKTIACHIQKMGISTTIIDAGLAESGTSACGGAVKPSPLTNMSSAELEDALNILQSCWGMEEVKFEIRPMGKFVKVKTNVVNMNKIDDFPTTFGKVSKIHNSFFLEGEELKADFFVVACGIWSNDIYPVPGLYSKKGCGFYFEKEYGCFVKTWAPYKQITIHPCERFGGRATWAGDGTAIIPENWSMEKVKEAMKRCRKEMKTIEAPFKIAVGNRPFLKSKPRPCFFERNKNVFCVTGAGKFGLLAAGWAAKRMENELLGKSC